MSKKTRLELTWIGKDERPKLEPRILVENVKLSHHASTRRSEEDIFDNMLVQGDNLLALKALEQRYAGRVKCVFIDPPYNTGSAFEHYDDGLEHSLWLTMMRNRLELIQKLLSDDGSLWITIDDNEAHYLKVLCDEIFGRGNFVANGIWQKVYSERMDAREFSASHDHLLIYKKSDAFSPHKLAKKQNTSQFGYYDEKEERYYRRRSLRKEGSESLRQDRPSMWYPIEAPDGSEIWPVKPDGTEGRWRWKKENVLINSNQLEFVKKSSGWEIYVKQYAEDSATRPPSTLMLSEDVGHNHEAKLEAREFNKTNVFATPKPERLLKHIITIATNPGDIVLDSFAGSGTTGAVAHKMGRRWIMVELGDHAVTHIVPRLKKVIDGGDAGGVTETTGWQGGGGFRFYRLGPSLLERDRFGNWVISKEYNGAMLAEALCKHLGFIYDPSQDAADYWRHGHSTETDFIYVTTQSLTYDALKKLSEEVGPKRTLLVCCKAYNAQEDSFPNLTVKKIPHSILSKCEWGRDDYSLQIANLPQAPDSLGAAAVASDEKTSKASKSAAELPLFDNMGGK